MNDILNIYNTIGSEKKKIKFFIFLILISAFLEIAGIALIVPVLSLILSSAETINLKLPFFSEDLITFKTINGKVMEFKTLVLHVGYNPQIHTRYNSCRVLNENLTFEESYSPVIFQPIKPYVKDIHYAYIPAVNGNVYTQNKTIILEDNIVELNGERGAEVVID